MITDKLTRLVPVATTPAGNGSATGPSTPPAGLAVTVDGPMTDWMDFGRACDIGAGENLYVVITVTEAFNNATSIEFIVKASSDGTIATGDTTIGTTGPILLLALNNNVASAGEPGAQFIVRINPAIVGGYGTTGSANPGLQYFGVFADVVGTAPTLGKVLVDVVLDPQTRHRDYRSAVTVV